MTYYARRFKWGESRFSTKARVEDGWVVIEQSERIDHPKIDSRSVVVLTVSDFKTMVKTLGLIEENGK